MRLIDILEKYSFGRYNENVKLEKNRVDTDIIRIYYDEFSETKWFEFGVYDLGVKDYTMEIINKIFNKKILNKEVNDIRRNNDLNIVEIFLKET